MGNFMSNEDCFAFHSEYYTDPKWRIENRRSLWSSQEIIRKGYTTYSKYKNTIYFIPQSYSWDGFIIKTNIKQKTSCAIKLDMKSSACYWKDYNYIAVNCQGYFLYSERVITLFGFDGQEIYTHKFGQKDYVECIYIYDNNVIYSETKKAGISTKIYCIDMLTQKKRLIWETQKGDSVFDNQLRKSYELERGIELPFFPNPSNIGNVSCEFLYANEKRIVAGYTRCKGYNEISYIINIDIAANKWSILDCFARGESKYQLSSVKNKYIFSFNMIDDTMWVGTDITFIDTNIKLVHTNIQRVAQLQGQYSVEWKLDSLGRYYYFDGKHAYIPDLFALYCIERNGEKKTIYEHLYQTYYFWYLDDVYNIPDEYERICFRDIAGGDSSIYSLAKRDIEELIQNAKFSQLEVTIATKEFTPESADYLKEKNNCKKVSGNQMTLVEFRQKAPTMTGFREKLLAYRKSLPNSWDYNAYVGILLGVGGSKHGDAACMNFAIGQGDNGNNTKKTLEAKGLMFIFEKYKSKKIDGAIMLSDVEDEIIAFIPEYKQIRQKLHEIIGNCETQNAVDVD